MARLPRCSSCVHRTDLFGFKCDFYTDGIPKNILIEIENCKYYEFEPDDDSHDDLPVAKGR